MDQLQTQQNMPKIFSAKPLRLLIRNIPVLENIHSGIYPLENKTYSSLKNKLPCEECKSKLKVWVLKIIFSKKLSVL